MPTKQLVAWAATEQDARTPWNYGGTPAAVLRAPADGNYAYISIPNGTNDSSSLVGADWRDANGTPFPWAGLTLSQVQLEYYLQNNGSSGAFPIAAYFADRPQTFYAEVWNGDLGIPSGTARWVTLATRSDANILAALAAGTLVSSIIVFNHGQASVVNALVDGMRITATYAGVSRFPWTEV